MTENNANNFAPPSVAIEGVYDGEYGAQLQQAHIAALQWYLDNGVDEALLDTPTDRTAVPDIKEIIQKVPAPAQPSLAQQSDTNQMLGAVAAIKQAQALMQTTQTLDGLKDNIEQFDGLSIKKTATNMVFADGNPKAHIMVIGEAPAADDDAQGKSFMGENGILLDKILACIGLDRQAQEPEKSVYITNVLNWRPPGNRTPTAAEMDICRPFIEKHIALIRPQYLIICGGMAAKTLLNSTESISKLRGKFHNMTIEGVNIPTMVTYHPAYLLKTPSQKKAVWTDMLMLKDIKDAES